MSHGYLIAQFFSPVSNTREDAYAAPLRFAREVLGAVREGAGPELAVGVRLSADELAPEGLDAAACAAIAGELCGTGLVDFASLVLGHSAYFASSSWIVPPPPARPDALAGPLAAVREAVDVPVIGTTQVVDVRAAEALIAGGGADAVGMTRALIADPDLVAKAAAGATDEIIACIGCNQGCIGHYHAGVPIGCVVNPRTGRERTLPRPSAGRRRDVLVIGGGPAGVAAALEAAGTGAAVTLLEQGAAIGGQLRLAGRAPAHRALWRRWQATAERRLARGGRRGAARDARERGGRRRGGARRARDRRAAVRADVGGGTRRRLGRPGGAAGRRGGRRVDGDREPGRARRPRPRRGLGRRLGRARCGRGHGRAGARRDLRLRGALARLDAPAVPAQPLPRPLRRARHPDPPPHGGPRRPPPPPLLRPGAPPARRGHDRLRPRPRARGRPVGRARGPAGRDAGGRRPRPADGRGGRARGHDRRAGSPRPRRRARAGGRRPPPRCGSARRASRGSGTRARWRSSPPCRAACRSRGSSPPRPRARAPAARAASGRTARRRPPRRRRSRRRAPAAGRARPGSRARRRATWRRAAP